MESLAQHYPDHLRTLRQSADRLLTHHRIDTLVIDAGQPLGIFLDDMEYPFKANPHFKHWVPLTAHPHCFVIVRPGETPTLLYYRPVDFWHKVAPVPTESWVEHWNLVPYADLAELPKLVPTGERVAYIGAHPERAAQLGLSLVNPQSLIDGFHFHRSLKSRYEIEAMRQANGLAVKGHQAARDAFLRGGSEFAIQQAYLSAVGQGENEVPYGNIIALNEHSAILHYTKLERAAPAVSRSFLIDAGASVHGYASDITRTYAADPASRFAELIAAMDQHEQAIVAKLQPGVRYTDLHLEMHSRVAQLLTQFGLAEGSTEALVASGVTKAFFPHGLGHPIGLQVHDVAGFMQDEQGTHLAPPEGVTLRCTRVMEANMVMTIEPGLYVIDSLLADLSDQAKAMLRHDGIDWLRPYGGVRIEDDVVVGVDGVDNLTRNQGLS
ncbi:Xaa-Pro dipeptidase [Ferrimonas marina]|uniref:Xaa-Pro dipeptidase n=1 Tax=Ferrimonas marina TaxID=299255 RepID=A0A1M5ZHT1_9GAMM|nr:Xaa-Pro dipeptidase [Ferrimonas marina]SHI23649.1 Xaa-Pro dipeptidase Metallo peptidase. MEROPS family M24B [Ferrimonas marina]